MTATVNKTILAALVALAALPALFVFYAASQPQNQLKLGFAPTTRSMAMSARTSRPVVCNAAGKGKPYNTQVVVGNDPEGVAIKKFTRAVQAGGYIIEAKRRRFFEPKVERMKRKLKEKHARIKLM